MPSTLSAQSSAQTIQSSSDEVLLTKSEDGREYVVKPLRPTIDELKAIIEKVEKYDTQRDPRYKGPVSYAELLMAWDTVLIGVYNKEEHLHGIVYFTKVIPGDTAFYHAFFWDKRTMGRQKLMLEIGRWFMDEFNVRKVNLTIPRYAYSALNRIYKIRFRLEGVIRHYESKMHDRFWFGVMREELTDEAIATGRLERDEEAARWYGVMDNDEYLMKKVLRRSNA